MSLADVPSYPSNTIADIIYVHDVLSAVVLVLSCIRPWAAIQNILDIKGISAEASGVASCQIASARVGFSGSGSNMGDSNRADG